MLSVLIKGPLYEGYQSSPSMEFHLQETENEHSIAVDNLMGRLEEEQQR